MPNAISGAGHSGSAALYASGRTVSGGSAIVGLAETMTTGDSLDISSPSGAGTPPMTPSGRPLRSGYTPTIADRFRFDIQNGQFGSGRRFNAAIRQFRQESNATYGARASLQGQVASASGGSGGSAAMFQLMYLDAAPGAVPYASNNDAIIELDRQRSQSLDLLRLL